MVRGRDAADVAMITAFGAYELELFRVWTDEVAAAPKGELLAMLDHRPEAAALTLASTFAVGTPGIPRPYTV